MTISTAIFASFAILVAAVFTFFTIVYLKEFAREEQSIKEYLKLREQQKLDETSPLVYILAPSAAPAKVKQQAAEPAAQKPPAKKDMN